MSLDSLGRAVQIASEENKTHNEDIEYIRDDNEPQSGEEQERRRKAYDTVSIADSTIGG